MSTMSNKQFTKITDLINEEMQRAVDMHGNFNSEHEAHSVIMEEFEEIVEETSNISEVINGLWNIIRKKDPVGTLYNLDDVSRIGLNYTHALINEAIQLAAMFKKLEDKIEKKI